MLKDKNILITGISGFVGSWLAKHLLEHNNNVYGIVRKRSDWSKPKNLIDKNIISNVKIVEGDLNDSSALGRAVDESKPDFIFHLGAQSFIPSSFVYTLDTLETNTMGTAKLLDVLRMKNVNASIVFAGSSEEYGLVFSSQKQYELMLKKYGTVYPEPQNIPEVPISESNPLRPMSPYGVSKVCGDFLMREYYHSYGLKTVVSRAFNHEGAGRGIMFVTSAITNQVTNLKLGNATKIVIGNVNAFRDWSHVNDVIEGYCLLAEKGRPGDVYNQGSMRTCSVLSYILLSLEEAGWHIKKIKTIKGNKAVDNPTEIDKGKVFGVSFDKTKVDSMLLADELYFDIKDEGIIVSTDKGDIIIEFDKNKFRPSDVPILLSDTHKIQKLGFKIKYSLKDIIKDQLNYYLNKENREINV